MLPPIIAEHKPMEGDDTRIIQWTPPDINWNPWINQPTVFEGAEEYQVKSDSF